MLETIVNVADIVAAEGIAVTVASMPTVKPLDRDFILNEAARVPLIAIFEEHTRHGGFAESVGLLVAEADAPVARLMSFHVCDDIASGLVGTQKDLRKQMGMDPDSAAARILAFLSSKRKSMAVDPAGGGHEAGVGRR